MGCGGRGERLVDTLSARAAGSTENGTASSVCDASETSVASEIIAAFCHPEGSLFVPPGQALAGAVEAAADPLLGSWPVGTLPADDSTEPWRQAIHAVVAGRRLAGWALRTLAG